MRIIPIFSAIALALSACNQTPTETVDSSDKLPVDVHSYANPNEARVTHLSLDLEVDFEAHILSGVAAYTINTYGDAEKIVFDTDNLIIDKVLLDNDHEAQWELGEANATFGIALTIKLKKETTKVAIFYSTHPDARALQWLDPVQTAGKKHPFLFTQSQAILARSWIPCQDSPGIRFTYDARIRVPEGMMALMSAENPTEVKPDGLYSFIMEQAVPSYLMAMSVGNIAFQSVGERTGVYAEPEMLEKSAWEFSEMENMVIAAEALYGPYVWGRYDLIVLPPSFPFGGMENPRLTFCTPTVIAGDKSLTALVAHELAHSWSGNLVTNATWNDFWLNEGFTVYFERRIMEALYGEDYSDMLMQLGYNDLEHTIEDMGHDHADTHLKLNLEGRNPDDGLTEIAYEKGCFFLVACEKAAGREAFDAFLKNYFTTHAFQVMDTERFLALLKEQLLNTPELQAAVDIDAWVYGPGLPETVQKPSSERFVLVDQELEKWNQGVEPKLLATANWTTHEWLRFIRGLPTEIETDKLGKLDKTFGFTASGNSEILAAWFQVTIRNGYAAANERIESFLIEVGRRKFLTPTYKAIVAYDGNTTRALSIYTKARPNYHAVAVETMDQLLGYSAL